MHDRSRDPSSASEPTPHDDGPTVGRSTLTRRYAGNMTTVQRAILDAAWATGPIQLHADSHTGLDDDGVRAAAGHGTADAGQPLPYLDTIQRAFGPHDVSGVRAHFGSRAAEANAALGSHAYATGNDIAFATDSPDLHLVAHEAAHVVQQRSGVHLSSAVGQAGDAYEQHADAVADAVVRGESAEALLGSVSGSSSSTAVQREESPEAAKPKVIAIPLLEDADFPPKNPAGGFVPRTLPDLSDDGFAVVGPMIVGPMMDSDAATRLMSRISAFMPQAGALYRCYNDLASGVTRLTADSAAAKEFSKTIGLEREGASIIEIADTHLVCEADEKRKTVADVKDANVDTKAEKKVTDKARHDEKIQPAIEAVTQAKIDLETRMVAIEEARSAIKTASLAFEEAVGAVDLIALEEAVEAAVEEKKKIQDEKDWWVSAVTLGLKGLVVVVTGSVIGAGAAAGAAGGAAAAGATATSTAWKVTSAIGGEYGKAVAGNSAHDLIGAGVEAIVGHMYQEQLEQAQTRIDQAVSSLKSKRKALALLKVKQEKAALDTAIIALRKQTKALSGDYYRYQRALNDLGRAVNDTGGHTDASEEVSAMIRALPIVERIAGELRALMMGSAFVPDRDFFTGAAILRKGGKDIEKVLDTYCFHKALFLKVARASDTWDTRRSQLQAVVDSVTHSA